MKQGQYHNSPKTAAPTSNPVGMAIRKRLQEDMKSKNTYAPLIRSLCLAVMGDPDKLPETHEEAHEFVRFAMGMVPLGEQGTMVTIKSILERLQDVAALCICMDLDQKMGACFLPELIRTLAERVQIPNHILEFAYEGMTREQLTENDGKN